MRRLALLRDPERLHGTRADCLIIPGFHAFRTLKVQLALFVTARGHKPLLCQLFNPVLINYSQLQLGRLNVQGKRRVVTPPRRKDLRIESKL